MSSAPAPTESPQQAWWIRWFPLLWWAALVLIAGIVLWLGARGLESDRKTVTLIALANLAWLGPLVWLVTCWAPLRRASRRSRWIVRGIVSALVVLGFFSIDVDYDGDSRWRGIRFAWQADPDEQLATLEARDTVAQWQTSPDDYPRFLGNGYWAEVPDTHIAADWQRNPPELVWKHPIGAGWSAFAVVGEYAVTQEQRGEEELVVCYRVATGEPVWTHSDLGRHDPASTAGGLGGVGPRATPTIADARVYTCGATGIVNCLDATTGEVVWAHDLAEDYQITPLFWANAGSPLVVPDTNLVVINGGVAADEGGHSLLAIHRDSGELAWSAGPQTTSYASPVYAVIDDVPQIVQVNEATVGGYRVADGKELWTFEQPGSSSGPASCSQPIPLSDNRLLVSKGYGIGARLVRLARDGDRFKVDMLWKKTVLKTKFSNLVIRDGYAYGLDHTFLSCVEVESGEVQWKKRRQPDFGHGQLLLAGDKLFILSETGEGVLAECNPEKYVELAAMQLLTDEGITWNNPAVAGQWLLVRNNRQAACYRLPDGTPPPSDVAASDAAR